MAETPEEAATVRRCQGTVIRALTGRCTPDEVADLVAGLTRLPADHPDRAPIAGAMILALHQGGPAGTEYEPYLADLLPMADADPPAGDQWVRARSMARMQGLMRDVVTGQVSDFSEIEAELAPVLSMMSEHPQAQPYLSVLRTMSEYGRAFDTGDASTMHRMPGELRKHREQLAGQPEMAKLLGFMESAAGAMSSNQRGEFAEAMAQVEGLRDAVADRAPDDMVRLAIQDSSAQLSRLYQAIGDVPADVDDPLTAAEELLARPDDGSDRALEFIGLSSALLRVGDETDLTRVDAAVRCAREALRLSPEGRPRHTFALQGLGIALYRRSELAGNIDGLAEATELVERQLAQLGGPHHKDWANANELLAMIRHRTGDIRESGEIGLVAQRGYAWRALMESDAAGAKIAIGDIADSTVELARRCLYAGDTGAALRALDSCRGLMLFAATELHKVPERLKEAGRADLGQRWASEGRVSSELRREALTVLAEQSDVDEMLDPPSMAEIRDALERLGADALVYLVAAAPPLPGLAVIATVDGRLAWMPLSNLVLSATDGVGIDVERYLAALADRSRDLAAPDTGGEFAGELDTLCDWAWRAAMGPVLDHVRAGRPESDVPRVVLVPMGDLARIPWHAARRKDGVHAVELAAITHAVSARLLCDNAFRPPVGLSSAGMVVGDPDTGGVARDLEDARLEAHAVRQSFYQGARYVGRRPNGSVSPSGAGTAAEVRRWLTDAGPAAGNMLHLACHGSFATGLDDAKSVLLLASEDSDTAGELSAEEIVDLLGAAPNRAVGLVVLAACNTGRSVHGYDEAYSLGTAFLAGKACSVLSTQWSIPDAQTPSLMYMFHHYVRREGLPPWQALREAQMWMLDPDREPPPGMPDDLVNAMPSRAPAPLAAWAGFVHYGH